MRYYVYIVRCKDGTLYTGMSKDVRKRIALHNAGIGAKYTRGRGPVVLVCVQAFRRIDSALRMEREIKSWTRAEKLKVCAYKGMAEICEWHMNNPVAAEYFWSVR